MNARTTTLVFGLFAVAVTCSQLAGFQRTAFALLLFSVTAAVVVRQIRARQASDRPAAFAVAAAREMLHTGDAFSAIRAASDAAAQATSTQTRNAALTTLAWAALEQGYARRAKDALDQIRPRHAVDLHCHAAVHAASGHPDAAIRALEVARTFGTLSREGAMLLVDLHVQQNRFDRAIMASVQNREVLGLENCRAVVKAAWTAGEFGLSAILASALFRATCAPEDAAGLLIALAYSREVTAVSQAFDDMLGQLRRVDGAAQARSFVAKLRADGNLPSTGRSELDRMLLLIDGPSTG